MHILDYCYKEQLVDESSILSAGSHRSDGWSKIRGAGTQIRWDPVEFSH